MINVADIALRTIEIGALAAGAGTLAAFVWATASEHVRVKKMTHLSLPDTVCDDEDLYWSFAALVTPLGKTSYLERAARRVDRLVRLSAAIQSPDSTGKVTAAMYRTAVEYESSVRHYLYKYFERSGVPLYDRKKRRMVPGEDYEHAKRYGPFPIPYQLRCAHADLLDSVGNIVQNIHNMIPDKLRAHAATLTFERPRDFY